MNKAQTKREGRIRRHNRLRTKVSGTKARPRLSIYKSNRYIEVQLIDDTTGTTLLAGSTKEAAGKKKAESAQWLGQTLAERAKSKGITTVVFDRGGFRYAGRIAGLAEAARENGLRF
ncbi:MAG: 50S ribosomal protein L18 [Minisyncoccia bacterium]